MSTSRPSYRRYARKKSSTHYRSSSHQPAHPFFDFGGEQTFFSGKNNYKAVNRKCTDCEKEDKKLQKKEGGANMQTTSPGVSSKIKSLQGGNSLPAKSKNFFEPKFNADFGDVKVHSDNSAHEMASSVNAKAFTYKNNIVFNSGQYNSETAEGKKLLAHELTHVVQQNNSVSKKEGDKKDEEKIQRAPTNKDFSIKGLDPATEKDNSIIRFDQSQSLVPLTEIPKIDDMATKKTTVDLTLNGFVSEEGSAGENKKIVDERLFNVAYLLKKHGHTASRTRKDKTADAKGKLNYRSMRSVEIEETSSGSSSKVANAGKLEVPCATDIPDAFIKSKKLMSNSITKLSGTMSKTDEDNFKILFKTNTKKDVLDNFTKIKDETDNLEKVFSDKTDCHSKSVDDTCAIGAMAYVTRKVTPARMFFCESFNPKVTDFKAEVILHEVSHALPGWHATDITYEFDRYINLIDASQQLNNADNYRMFARVMSDPKAKFYDFPIDEIKKDGAKVKAGSSNEIFANKILAYLEKWVWEVVRTSGFLHERIHDSLSAPSDWKNAPSGSKVMKVMHDIAPLFGLTDPGTGPAFKTPDKNDRMRMAGIFDRYNKMDSALDKPVVLNEISAGPEAWTKNAGSSVDVLNSFFSATDPDAVRYLLTLMAASMDDIPSSLTDAYVDAADKNRTIFGVGPK